MGKAAAKAHLTHEDRRMRKARKEWDRYVLRMRALGLHPLNLGEILDRQCELSTMRTRLPDEYSDTEQMRAIWSFSEARLLEGTA